MSLDPYMRGRMDDAKSYAQPVPVGGLMEGGSVGEVIASNSPDFKSGDYAFGMFGWATHGVAQAQVADEAIDAAVILHQLIELGT